VPQQYLAVLAVARKNVTEVRWLLLLLLVQLLQLQLLLLLLVLLVEQGYHGADDTKDDADAGRCKEHETEPPQTMKEHHATAD